MEYTYFDFRGHLARIDKEKMWTYMKEFYENGEWVKNVERDLYLTDVIMDYGDYGPSDYDVTSEERAMQMMQEMDKTKKY